MNAGGVVVIETATMATLFRNATDLGHLSSRTSANSYIFKLRISLSNLKSNVVDRWDAGYDQGIAANGLCEDNQHWLYAMRHLQVVHRLDGSDRSY
jgi:hypothetical protein